MAQCDTALPLPCISSKANGGEPALLERNTFLELPLPEPIDVCRASTEPGSGPSCNAEQSDAAEDGKEETCLLLLTSLPPPPLELEAFETYDSFDGPLESASPDSCEMSTALGSTASPGSGYRWRAAPPEGNHGFQNAFSTSPGAGPSTGMPLTAENFTGHAVYEWCDNPLPYTSDGAAAHLISGNNAGLADPIFLTLPPAEPILATSFISVESVVPPPPCCPAPCLDMGLPPSAPTLPPGVEAALAPSAPAMPPGKTLLDAASLEPEAPANDATALEISRQPSGITCTVFGSIHYVSWQVDARKLERDDKQAVSPQFVVALSALGPREIAFRIALYPRVTNDAKRGASFKKAKGKGKVVLKCEAELPQTVPEIGFRIGIGRGDKLQLPRGPVAHNFFEQPMRGLAKADEEWDFNAAVDESGTFVVSVALAPSVSFLTTPTWGSPMLGL